jgi:hypothetical protein
VRHDGSILAGHRSGQHRRATALCNENESVSMAACHSGAEWSAFGQLHDVAGRILKVRSRRPFGSGIGSSNEVDQVNKSTQANDLGGSAPAQPIPSGLPNSFMICTILRLTKSNREI